MMIQVLIVEDEAEMAQLLAVMLRASGMNAYIINSGKNAIEWVKKNTPDIIILDIMLPEKSGIDICKEVRSFSDVPVIMTTAKTEEVHRLAGFEVGANDYVCKPYSAKEVIARIKNVHTLYNRRNHSSEDIVLERKYFRVSLNDKSVDLTQVEFNILSLLYMHPNRIYSRENIIALVYSDSRIVSDRTIDSHIKNLRKKLTILNDKHNYVRSIYGTGYKFDPTPIVESIVNF
ncbi:response regulator [Spartinivicinus ruber]|uniref:response regulator n=1 Tax=Spartinivicinus ruber TaxID=2683272 RepID=UPI0013D81915|nr:response regulator [Spartinivicinus ruber]